MAISEPDVGRYGTGEPPGAGEKVNRSRRPWRRRLAAGFGLLLLVAVGVLWALAATYQPVQFGGLGGGGAGTPGDFPGLPAGSAQLVNNFGGLQGEYYFSPRRDAFTIITSIGNNGPKPVTIEAVSALDPSQANEPSSLRWPLASAGPVKWALEQTDPQAPRSVRACTYSTPCQLGHLSLEPQEYITFAIPVRFVDSCFEKDGSTSASSFYVEERFGPFTHWVKVPYGVPYLFEEPEPAGTGGASCLPALSLHDARGQAADVVALQAYVE